MSRRPVRLAAAAAWLCAVLLPGLVHGQERPARFLGREEILLYGIGLRVEPAHQTVPKDIATIVSTYLQAPQLPDGVPPFAPDAVVRATLRGPSFGTAQELTIQPNTPFNIPPLTVPGTHTLEDIRLVSGGEVLLRGTPDHVTIEVIERLLITQVTARALTASEIREKGIVFDQSNFQAYNFSAAFAIQDRLVDISFPVLLPSLQGATDVDLGQVSLPAVTPPGLPQLKTIIPDTLKLQTQIPNLSVIGFTLKAPLLKGNDFVVPPIPGVIVIPGDIGFLNQYFSVLLMVGNVAPAGSGLEVSDLRAEILLPAGRDSVVNTPDDPLRMAFTAQGESPRVQLVVQPGPDGKLGTGDDVGVLRPGDSGNAEYLVEGRREGSHVVEMEITGTLHGLPIGPVQVRGRAAGAVLVRNPRFTLTFTHPEAVAAGEPYTLDVTVTNTSESPANFVSVSLYPRNVSGATVVGEPARAIESIAPGDSATVSFDLVSRLTGKVTAATLDSDEKVAGRFELKAAVGELGVPVSPDTLVLPKEAGSLPADFRGAALGLLGKAYAVATAPPAALPRDVRRFSRKVVIDRAVEVAEAGFRYTLREPLADTAAQLLMDFAGSNYTRLAQLVRPEDLAFDQENYLGFDELRRRSVRGDVFAAAVAGLLAPDLAARGTANFHHAVAQRWSYRPGHVSVVVASSGGELPVSLSIADSSGRMLGGRGDNGKFIKNIPFGDLLPFVDSGGAYVGEMALLAVPEPGAYSIRLTRRTGPQIPYTVSIVAPLADGSLRQTVFTVGPDEVPSALSGDPFAFTFELVDGDAVVGVPINASSIQAVGDPPPSVISVIQQKDADAIRCEPGQPGYPVGRVVAVLFSEEVTPASVGDRLTADAITGFAPEANRVVGVALQPGRRIAFVALRDPLGPFIPRQIGIDGAMDLRGQPMTPFSGPMEPTVGTEGGVVNGRVVRADGTPVPFANVRLFYLMECGPDPVWIGISSKSADAEARFSWDYVLRLLPDKIVAVDPESDEFRSVRFNIQRDGQRLNVDLVFLGRGTFSGTTRSESGALLRDTAVRVTSLTDHSQYGARTDANGRFSIPRIPVGNIFVEAINTTAKAKFAMSEAIPFAGATIDRDITLLDIEQQKITVRYGTVKGHVLRTDGVTPAAGVPVYVWYTHLSQPGVRCPGLPPPGECAIAGGVTDSQGAYSFPDVAAGSLRVSAFDQDGLVQGEARLQLAADATVDLNVLLVGGLGTVTGRVLSPDGSPVAGASVGGGLSLVTTNTSGEFVLPDVPVGRRDIVAVSELLKSSGRVTIDLTRAGDTVSATIVLDAVASISGTVVHADGVTPVAGAAVYAFHQVEGGFEIVGTATTNPQGGYRMDGIRQGEYEVSSFNTGFTDGNIVPAVLKYHGQVFRADIRWRGGNGRVVGTVFDDDGQTPLRALVSLSGDQVRIAGGRVGVAFEYVNHHKIAETDFTTGRFSLSGAWVGPVTVSAAGQFSPDPVAVSATIPSPNATVEVNLRLQPTSQIRGTVVQPNGVNPAGANLIVRYKSEAFKVICTTNALGEESCDSIPQGIQEEVVVTDENGQFWLPIVNAGPFSVSVEDVATGRTGHVKGAVRAGETAELTVRLLGLGELSVQVFSSDTVTPIPGAKVVVKQLNFPQKEVEGRADTDGTIVFIGADGFSEGEFAIEAIDLRNGFAGRGTARITRDGEQVSVRVYLFDAAGVVSGRIFASDGRTAVANAEIVLSNGSGPIAFALSGVDGSYRIEYVPLGDFRIEAFEARTARRAAARGRIDLAGQDVPLNLVQAALGVVKGQVLESASLAPLKGWTVTLAQRSASGLALGTLQTTSALDGGYLFPGSSQGTFTLTARRATVNGSASASGTIEHEGQTVDVPLLVKIVRPLTGTITGTVLTASGAPAPNSPIEICHPQRSCENPVTLTADPDGNFSLPNVPLGRFLVVARSQVTREAGSTPGELAFDGDIASVRVVLGGTSEVRGVVERSGGTPAAGVRVTLTGLPDTGCPGESCTVFTDSAGAFAFVDVPSRTFTVTAVDPINAQFKGAAGGSLNPGEVKQIRIVLTPSFAVTGRALLPGGIPAPRIVAELIATADPERRQYAESGADGVFTFAAVASGTYQLLLSDPLGPGLGSRGVSVVNDLAVGDITLDTAAPGVSASDPPGAATAVARDTAVRITFTEPIRPSTINADTVSLAGPTGPVTATLDISENDSVVTLTPLAPLVHETRYTLRVRDVQDRFGKVMAADYVATFTTVDITPPTVADASPAPGSGGAPIYAPVRIRFSETLDVTRFTGAPILLTGPAGAVAGRTDYLVGNTVVVFTPNVPLAEDAPYTVTVQRGVDLAGNLQASAFSYQFTTTDRTPPQIASLTPANGGRVVENGTTSVLADAGTTHDVAVVDWYLNDVPVFADRTAPFELAFRADTALYGPAGSRIRVSAIATDTSGNRGDPRAAEVTITPDQPPSVTILAPADGLSARNGDRIVLRVRATDDLGITHVGYRAVTGNPADAITRALTPAPADRTEEFVFYIPASAAPGTTIAVHASAADTKAQVAQASIAITVLDALPPTVTITGATSGARVFPGQQTTVVVTAQDVGRIASVRFTAGGILAHTETRQVEPPQPSIVTSFTITVPTTARAGQTIVLGAVATDAAGNSANAAQVVLPVADTTPPTIVLAPETGSFDAVPGRTVNIVATAEDEVGITRIDLTASGAVTFGEARQVSPPTGSAVLVFAIPVPEAAEPGTQIHVTALATDLATNVSEPASLTLTVISPVQVTLPPSAIVDAGSTVEIPVQISAPAPAGGVRLDFSSDQPAFAIVTPFVVVPEGQTAATFTATGVAGGSTQIRALSGGVPRASMTVTVRGGIVSGIVRDALLVPVPGAQLTVSDGVTSQNVVADAEGRYTIDGVAGPDVSVRALDPVTRLYGHSTGAMAGRLGYVTVNVVLIPAAAIHGTVFEATGAAAGEGVRVDIFTRHGVEPLATTFTGAEGRYAFPLVTLGEYRLDATAADGRRGRSTILLGESGQDAEVNIVYLGTGTVSGTVRLNGATVANAQLTFRSWSIFGHDPEIVRNAGADGTFSFSGVPIGSFSVVARDLATGQAGSASGSVSQHGETVQVNIALAQYGTIEGRVFRSDGVTPVAGATVRLLFSRETLTDAEGHYRFDIIPLGTYSVEAQEPATNGYASGTVNVVTHGGTSTLNLSFLPQGRLHVTVTDAGGTTVAGAHVAVQSELSGRRSSTWVRTGSDGTALVDYVLAGTFTVNASYGVRRGSVSGSLPAGERLDVTVELSPTGSLAGVIYEADGQTPAAGARVSILNSATSTVTGADGGYRLDGLLLGGYDLVVHDAANRARARTMTTSPDDDLVITSNGEVVTRDFTFIGLGTVTGRVINPDGSSAQNMTVQIWYGAAGFQATLSTRTDGGGYYSFGSVPVGGVTVVASDLARQLYGERTGVVERHAESVPIDIALTSNAIELPRTIYDANRLRHDVQRSGSLNSGAMLFLGNNSDQRGAMLLDITAGGSTTRFSGPEVPTIEDGGREIAVRQENVGGLSVTRKIFVPRAGYFARYLEIVRNPTAAPITIDLDLESFPDGTGIRVGATSNGDTGLTSEDDWVATTRDNGMAVALLFNGAGETARVADASFERRTAPYNEWARVAYGWRGLTIEPGATVAIMHFAVQQLSLPAAIASAQRLGQLPPEALSGLSPEEIAAIRNFAVPPSGESALAPLPALTGRITGRVFEHDGTTPLSDAAVRFRSDLILFGRIVTAQTTAEGTFSLTGALSDSNTTTAIPETGFTLDATHPASTVVSPPATGTFEAPALPAVVDVVFTNTSIVRGVLLRHTGAAVQSGRVSLAGPTLPSTISWNVGSDSSYRLAGVPAGAFQLSATWGHPQGTALSVVQPLVLAAGETRDVTVMLPPTGSVAGTVRTASGQPASGIQVMLRQVGEFSRYATTDSGGTYTLTDVPAGVASVTATEPLTRFTTTVETIVAQDTTAAVDLGLIPVGSVRAQVNFSDGRPAVGSSVRVDYQGPDGAASRSGTADAAGIVTIIGIPAGPFTAVAAHPSNSALTVSAQGTVVDETTPAAVSLAFPATGTVTVTVTRGAGVLVGSSQVRLIQAGLPDRLQTTDSTGRVMFAGVAAGAFTVRAVHPENVNLRSSAPGTVASEGEDVAVSLVLPPIGSVTGTVRLGTTAIAGVTASLRSSSGAVETLTAVTDAQGRYAIAGVPGGGFTVTVEDFTRNVYGTVSGQVTTDLQTVTVDIALIDNVVQLETDRYDGNGFRWDIQGSGQIDDGTNDAYDGGLRLRLRQGTANTLFSGASSGILEDAGREIAIRQAGLLGLEVTRKVYVPLDGYFARYVEVLTNPGTTPITVDVTIESNLGSDSGTNRIATSSGDTGLGVDDLWIVTDDVDNGGDPSMAHIFGGVGAARAVSTATISSDWLTYGWSSITVEPGQSVMLMHFAVQHFTRAQARAAAERLVQLPPEALAGLSEVEMGAISNFAVPSDGSSPLPPVYRPDLGTLTGRVYASDGVTPLGDVTVQAIGTNTLFGRRVSGTANSSGEFTLANVPTDGFTLTAYFSSQSLTSTATTGAFDPGQLTATANVLFSNAGMIRGSVRTASGDVFANQGSINSPYTSTITAGVYTLPVVAPGTRSVSGSIQHPQGTGLSISGTTEVQAGTLSTLDLPLPPVGTVTGTIRTAAGEPVPNVTVSLNDLYYFLRQTTTNAQGQYALPEIPVGTRYVHATNPTTGVRSSGSLVVEANATHVADLALNGVASLRVLVTNPDGTPAVNTSVVVSASGFSRSGTTSATGEYTVSVPSLPLTVRAYAEGFTSYVYREVAVAAPADGENVTVNVGVQAVATVRVHARDAAGNPLASRYVYYQSPWRSSEDYAGSTNAQGYFDIRVPEGSYVVSVNLSERVRAGGEVTSGDHRRLIEHLLYDRVQATVLGAVYAGDGVTPVPGAVIEILDGPFVTRALNANTLGEYNSGVIRVPSTPFTIRARSAGLSASSEASVAVDGVTIRRDFVLPSGAIKGQVTLGDGTPVESYDVFATTTGDQRTTYYPAYRGTGEYLFLLPAGAYNVSARLSNGLSVSASAEVADDRSTVVLDLRMPPTGTVTGVFRKSDGSLASWDSIMLASPLLEWPYDTWADGSGRYTVEDVPVGPFTVQGCAWTSIWSCETVAGELTSGGEIVTVNITGAPTGSLRVRLLDAQGNPPVWSSVEVYGVTRHFDEIWTSQNPAVFSEVPEGSALVLAEAPGGYAQALVTVLAGRQTDVELRLGAGQVLDATLAGSDGSSYRIDCAGEVSDGSAWTWDQRSRLAVDGMPFPCRWVAGTEENRRELVIGPAIPGSDWWGDFKPLAVSTRKVFSPAAGGFVRYYDRITNRGTTRQTFDVEVTGTYWPATGDAVLSVAPGATSNTYMVLAAADQSAVALGLVFAGAGAQNAPAVTLGEANQEHAYRWSIALEPGESAALLHYVVHRAAADASGAQVQAQALAELTDPAALEGLSPEELALIVNFAVPGGGAPQLRASIEGQVVAADGQTGMGDAAVYAADATDGRLMARVTPAPDGTFRFDSLRLTSAGVRLVALWGTNPEQTASRVVTVTSDGQVVTGVTLTLPITVMTGDVRMAGTGEIVAGAAVFAARAGDVNTYTTTSTAAGRYSFLALPDGTYTVTAMDPLLTTSVREEVVLPASSSATLDLQLPAAAVCTPPEPSLLSWWRGEGDVANAVHGAGAGTASGAVTYAPGKVGQGFSFTGSDGAVELPLAAPLDGPFSLETWVTVNAVGSQLMMTRPVTAGDSWDLTMQMRPDLALQADVLVAGGYVTLISTRRLEIGRAHHVVLVYDGDAVRLYLDAQLTAVQAANPIRPAASAPLRLGYTPAATLWCNCILDEVKVYGSALTAAEVQGGFASAAAGGCTDLTVLARELPMSVQGQPYAATLRASGGVAPVSFAVTDGALAPGLTLSPDGSLTGTPTDAGSYTFTVTVTDAAGATASATFTQECGTCLATPAGAIAFWNANENALDPIGGHDGTLSGVAYAPGIDGRAFGFAGAGRITHSTPTLEVSNDFTIEFWANPSGDRFVTGETTSGISGTSSQRYAIAPEYRGTSGEANVGVSVGRNGISVFEHGPYYLPSPLVYNAPVVGWTHIAVVYRSGQPFLYVNGAFVREGLRSGQAVYLSKQMGDFSGYGYYYGLLDEVALYDRALTAEEISAIASATAKRRCQ